MILPDADIRGYYHQLGIKLPDSSYANASVRCFAAPEAHRREDHDPSCSVNTISGAWRCHGCGARGGAYDAAIAKGQDPRTAIDLMIDYGLIERRARLHTAREVLQASRRRSASPVARVRRETQGRSDGVVARTLYVTDQDICHWQAALSRRPSLLARLAKERDWNYQTVRALELGFDRERITIPIRNGRGLVRGVLRYQPGHTSQPKMLAVPGTRLGLIPHPAREISERILLVEGPPDMVAARSHGLPAIAIPGDHAWRLSWAQLLAGRHITIIMDADDHGRAAAQRIASDLAGIADPDIFDLGPSRPDGYDLTDWLLENRTAEQIPKRNSSHTATRQYRKETNDSFSRDTRTPRRGSGWAITADADAR